MLRVNGDDLLTTREAVAHTGISHQSIYQAVSEGRLKCASANPYWFKRSELDRWMEARAAKRRPGPR